MKFYKLLVLFCLISTSVCFITSCSDDDSTNSDPSTTLNVVGKWILTHADGIAAETDSMFCMELKSDSVELYSVGEQIDENNKKWLTGTFNYSVSKDSLITINGSDLLGKTHHVVLKIVSLTQTEMKYTITDCVLGGVTIVDKRVYTCRKATEDYTTQIIGIWYGKCASNNTSDTQYHYWKYSADNTYEYYYQENGTWVKKQDNNGIYSLYGNLFVSNYTNDLQSGIKGLTFECWILSFENSKMKWTALRNDNKVVTYEMEKVDKVPTSK